MDETGENPKTNEPQEKLSRDYQKFKQLVESFFTKNPVKKEPDYDLSPHLEKLSEEENSLLQRIGQMDPKEFLEMFTQDPPSIMFKNDKGEITRLKPNYIITPPPPSDLELAQRKTFIPENLNEDEKINLELALLNLAAYLKTPKVEDGFGENHENQRVPYRNGMNIIFKIIEIVCSSKSNILKAYNDFYTNNSLTTNKQTLVYSSTNILVTLAYHNKEQWAKTVLDVLEMVINIQANEKQIKNIKEQITFLNKMLSTLNLDETTIKTHQEKIKELSEKLNGLEKPLSNTEKEPIFREAARRILQIFTSPVLTK